MSGESEHGTRFARDLRRIRRARGVSLADIHDATKMAYDLIKRFEHDALINHPQFNRVYLRLFVRGYVKLLGLDVEMTLEALDLAIKGRYAGSLAKEYLGESEEERKKKSPKQDKKTSHEKPAASESDKETGATPSAHADHEAAKIPHAKPAESDRKDDSAAPDSAASDAGAPDPEAADVGVTNAGTSSPEQPAVPKVPVAKAFDPRAVSSPKGASDRSASVGASSSGARPSQAASVQALAGSDSRWIFLGVVVVVVGLGIWGLTRMGSGSDSVPELAEPENDMTDEMAPATNIPVQQSLPDTLNITIVADKGSVAPIRVTLDDDLRRPYWIDRGGSMTFRMVDRIILEQQLDSVTVQVEGMTYPVSRPAGEDMVTLTRDAVHSWFSSIQP